MRKRNISKLSKLGRMNTLGLGSTVGLAVLGLMLLLPTVDASTNAADSASPLTELATMKAETYVYSTLGISMSEGVNLDIVPTSKGAFTSGTAKLSVTTNNTTGYSVYMQTRDNSSSLKPANGMVDGEIGPVTGTMTATSYQDNLNSWGYAIVPDETGNDLAYKAIPKSSDAAIITSDTLAAEDTYDISFGVAVGPTLPAGSYYNSVLISAVANPIAVHTLSGITYMQEMSPYVCDYSDEGETKQLVDMRDSKEYWVEKLKDGHCWMTQNLALDLNESTLPLKSSTTSLASGQQEWSPREETSNILTDSNKSSGLSWNIGEWVYNSPTATACNVGDIDGLADACGLYTNVDGWSPTFVATNDSAINLTDETFDAHYLVGNYYDYNAAFATDETNFNKRNMSGSICPRGWRLPNSGTWSSDEINYQDSDTYRLMVAYGWNKDYTLSDYYNEPINTHYYSYRTPTNSNPGLKLTANPLYVAPTGYVRAAKIRDVNSSIYVTSTGGNHGSTAFVYGFMANSNYVTTAWLQANNYGQPVRCLAQ